MSFAISDPQSVPTPRTRQERLELARALFRKFHAQCFWHSPSDLEITDESIDFVIKGLQANGGHRGFKLAGKLRAKLGEE